MQSHSREATGTVTPFDRLKNMQSHSCEATGIITPFESQLRSDYYPILLDMQSHSREATVTPRRRGKPLVSYKSVQNRINKIYLDVATI